MAEYVTLKKPDGTVIYPQSVIAQVADGSVTSSQIDWSTINLYNYSSSEQVIGTWIDGRNVYRKVFTGTTKNVATENITNTITNFGNVIKVYGFIEASGTGSQPIQRVVPDNIGTYGIGIGDIDQSRILFHHPSSDYQGQPYALVLEYIKTS